MLLKTCSVCKRELPIDKFYKWKYGKDGLRSQCKDCIKLSNSKYYETHKEQILNNVKEYAESNCIKCGEQRSYVIDFHHIDPSTKEFTIGNSYRGNDDKLIKEIKKCACLCSNCHREFHYLYGILPDNPISNLEEYLNMPLLDIKQVIETHLNNTKLTKEKQYGG